MKKIESIGPKDMDCSNSVRGRTMNSGTCYLILLPGGLGPGYLILLPGRLGPGYLILLPGGLGPGYLILLPGGLGPKVKFGWAAKRCIAKTCQCNNTITWCKLFGFINDQPLLKVQPSQFSYRSISNISPGFPALPASTSPQYLLHLQQHQHHHHN